MAFSLVLLKNQQDRSLLYSRPVSFVHMRPLSAMVVYQVKYLRHNSSYLQLYVQHYKGLAIEQSFLSSTFDHFSLARA